jgi:hypothetical protein
MRSPERHQTARWCLAIVAVVAGCTSPADTASPNQSMPVELTAAPTSTARANHQSPRAAPGDTAPAPAVATTPEEAKAAVAVAGGDLPPALVDGYASNGGDLLDPAEWHGRFGPAALPELTGPGVRLVEGLRRSELRDGNWIQTDEAGWLAMTRDDRDSMMGSLRAAADIDGTPSTTTSADQGADCVIDTYPAHQDGVSWQVQGCSYETFPGMVSLGISRTGPTDAPPALLDPTIATVADTIDASVTFTEVRFGEPAPDGSTLRLSAHLTTQLGFEAAADAVTGGPLAGWQTFPGEGSLLLSAPTGATWTLSAGVAVFTWAGRW